MIDMQEPHLAGSHKGKVLYHFENELKSGRFPLLIPEIGEDLVENLLSSPLNDLPQHSLKTYLTHAPLVTNYWNNFKAIYKILESKLLQLNNQPDEVTEDISKKEFLIQNIAIILRRLEHHDECFACNKKFYKRNTYSKSCKNLCEQWPGGIRYSKRFLRYRHLINNEYRFIDKLKLEKKIKKIEGVLEADIVIKNAEKIEEESEAITLLLLTEGDEQSEDLKSFITQNEFSNNNLLDTENLGLPKFSEITNHKHWSKNPWAKRRSIDINHIFKNESKYRERYPELSESLKTSKPSIKTINYMRRRGRRLLRKLSLKDPSSYVMLSMKYLEGLLFPRRKRLSELWLLNEIIFGKTNDISHSKHGRGNIRYLNNFLARGNDNYPCKEDWLDMLENIQPYLQKNSHYLCISEFYAKIWNHHDNPNRDTNLFLSTRVFNCYLQSSSKHLVNFAVQQLKKNIQTVKLLHPASISRALATLESKDAQNLFNTIFNELEVYKHDPWLTRFIYELDDVVYSLISSKKNQIEKHKGIILGMLSLRFAWPGIIKTNITEKILSNFNTPFQWTNKTPISVWSNSKWKMVNTSRAHFGLIGWHHSIFDKFLLNLPRNELSNINTTYYLKQANPERLLNLMSFKVPLLRCHGNHIRLSDAKEFNLPPHLKKKLKSIQANLENNSSIDSWMEELGKQHLTAMDGHFTPSDLRHEACELCKADSKSNIEFFKPFIFQNNDTAYQYRFNKGLPKQSIGQQRHLFPSLRKKSFWTKVHKLNEHFTELECPESLAEELLMELNHRIKNHALEKSLLSKVSKLTSNIIKHGNFKFLLDLLNENIYVSENLAIDNLLSIEDYEWEQTLSGGAKLPVGTVISESWLGVLWKKLGGNDTSVKSIVQARFINNPIFKEVIAKTFIPDFDSVKSDEHSDYVLNLLEHNSDHFLNNASDHLKVCLSSDQTLSEKAIQLKVQYGMDAIFALNLLESNSPLGERYANEYFNSIDIRDPEFEQNLVMICDSPNKHTREFGLELLNQHHLSLNMPKILLMLKENRHKNIRFFVASYLANNENRFIDISDFDIGILRTRNIERKTKELVKKRISTQIKRKAKSPDMLFNSLKELSYGLIQSDKEWALKHLTLLGRDKHHIPEIKIKDIEETNNESCANI